MTPNDQLVNEQNIEENEHKPPFMWLNHWLWKLLLGIKQNIRLYALNGLIQVLCKCNDKQYIRSFLNKNK
jgi:hypothetical protein